MPNRQRRDPPRPAFDEGQAADFLARARAGENIHALLREPGMPSRKTYDHWRTIEPPFAEATFALRRRRDAGLGERGRARWRAFDPVLADRIVVGLNKGLKLEAVLAADPELPCRKVLARWRREQPQFDRVLRTIFAAWRRRPARARRAPAALTRAVVEHIVTGGSFASFSLAPGGPSRTTLRRWVRVDRDFAAAVARACRDREDWYEDQIELIAEAMPGASLRALKRAAAPLSRQLARLRHRPGAVHRRPAGRAPGPGPPPG